MCRRDQQHAPDGGEEYDERRLQLRAHEHVIEVDQSNSPVLDFGILLADVRRHDVHLRLRTLQRDARTQTADGKDHVIQPDLFRWIDGDRKSTRLNSSHLGISYAVFCLKKKKNTNNM